MISHREALELSNRLEELCKDHEEWRGRKCINLIPSENIMSSKARSLLSSDFVHRYTSREHYYMGTRFIDEVETLCQALARRVFHAKFADIRPISGHTCDLAVALLYSGRGDGILSVSPQHGGYPGFSRRGLAGILHLKNIYFPFRKERMNIEVVAAAKIAEKQKPKVTFFGASFFLFPHPVKELAKPLEKSIRVYDGSHVLGLLAGGQFQSPLEEGCDILLGSTHKSFFGPQGGIILSNNHDIAQRIEENLHPGIIDNLHWNRILALAMTLVEMLRFGERYSSQVVKNAKALAKSLSELGIQIRCRDIGFTESHQVLLGYSRKKSAELAENLERSNIIVDRGIRLGTSEVTRRGMKESEMGNIAELMHDAIANRRDVASKAERLSREFSGEEYCL